MFDVHIRLVWGMYLTPGRSFKSASEVMILHLFNRAAATIRASAMARLSWRAASAAASASVSSNGITVNFSYIQQQVMPSLRLLPFLGFYKLRK